MEPPTIRVAMIDDSVDTYRLVDAYLARSENAKFVVTWFERSSTALQKLESNPAFDIVLIDYFLPEMNGLETFRAMLERKIELPVAFLTVNKDTALAIEVMKLGAEDYLIKEDILSPVFGEALIGIYEKHRLRREIAELEKKKRRLEAMQEIVVDVAGRIEKPLSDLRRIAQELEPPVPAEKAAKYVGLIRQNIERLEGKMDKLKNLKDDKTVQYIKDIKMIDLS